MDVAYSGSSGHLYDLSSGFLNRVNGDHDIYMTCREPMGSGELKLVSLKTGLIHPWPTGGDNDITDVKGIFVEEEAEPGDG